MATGRIHPDSGQLFHHRPAPILLLAAGGRANCDRGATGGPLRDHEELAGDSWNGRRLAPASPIPFHFVCLNSRFLFFDDFENSFPCFVAFKMDLLGSRSWSHKYSIRFCGCCCCCCRWGFRVAPLGALLVSLSGFFMLLLLSFCR